MSYTLTLKLTELSGATIVRNIYECFRMLGDAILVSKGMESKDHLAPIEEILKVKVETKRPINLIENWRILRHNINYYGYKPSIEEVKDVISIAESTFQPLLKAIKKEINATQIF